MDEPIHAPRLERTLTPDAALAQGAGQSRGTDGRLLMAQNKMDVQGTMADGWVLQQYRRVKRFCLTPDSGQPKTTWSPMKDPSPVR